MKTNETWIMLRILWGSQKSTIITTLTILAVVLVSLYGLYTYREGQLRRHLMEADIERIVDDPSGEERVLSIARRFKCVSCDTCRNMPLETCDCRTAKAERNYVRQEIGAHSEDSIVVRHVASLFGGLRVDSTR